VQNQQGEQSLVFDQGQVLSHKEILQKISDNAKIVFFELLNLIISIPEQGFNKKSDFYR
jgi:hypothetical protein